MLWDNFNTAYNRLQRGINQMYTDYEDLFTGYMRSYDVSVTDTITGYEAKECWGKMADAYEEANGYDSDDVRVNSDLYNKKYSSTIVDSAEQNIYQFKLANDSSGQAYAIRNSSGDASSADGVNRAFYLHNARTKADGDTTVVTVDAYNLLKGLESGYQIPKSYSELKEIVASSNTAYDGNLTIPQYIKQELSNGGITDAKIPVTESVDYEYKELALGPNFLLLRSNIILDIISPSLFNNNLDTHTTWANISMPYQTSNEVYLNLEGDIGDHTDDNGDDNYLKDKELVVMYTKDSSAATTAVTVETSGSGSTSVTVDGHEVKSGDKVSPGKSMTIKAKPAEGQTVDSIQLLNSKGEVLNDIISDTAISEQDGSSSTITTQELLKYYPQDEEGNYVFTLSSPYQNAKVKVSYREIDYSLNTYAVKLVDATEDSTVVGLMQFGGYDYLSEKEFAEGETVTVSLTGYAGYTASDICVLDADGNNIDTSVQKTNTTLRTGRIRPTEQVFTFVMPAEEVTVTAVMQESHTVNVASVNHVSHSFDGLGCISFSTLTDSDAVSWDKASAVDFAEGETVALSFEVENGYELDAIEVYDSEDALVDVKIKDKGIEFAMPALDVTVKCKVSDHDRYAYRAELDLSDENIKLNFGSMKNSVFEPCNVQNCQLEAEETVFVQVTTAEGYHVEGISILGQKSGAEYDSEFDQKTGIAHFTMPSEDVLISACASISLEAIEISPTEAELEKGDTLQLTAEVTPATAEETIVWSSSNTSVATVDDTGLVTAVASGSAVISAAGKVHTDIFAEASITVTGEDFSQDEDGHYLIGSYQELELLAEKAEEDSTFAEAIYEVTNDIVFPEDHEWVLPICADKDNGFGGAFHGNGYVISGLNSAEGGLFGYIDETGAVDNIYLIRSCFGDGEGPAGGIAIENHGTISFCVNGVNTNGIFVNPTSGETESIKALNCTVEGTRAGGIAASNYGTIFACRNAADVTGGAAGGIAGYNEGTITNCASNGEVAGDSSLISDDSVTADEPVLTELTLASAEELELTEDADEIVIEDESDDSSVADRENAADKECPVDDEEQITLSAESDELGAGGFAGCNYGEIIAGYSSAKVSHDDASLMGSISGYNNGEITDVFYSSTGSMPAVGSASEKDADDSNTAYAKSYMMDDDFLEELQDGPSNAVEWIREDEINSGLPRIHSDGDRCVSTTLYSEGIAISGIFQSGISVKYLPMEEEHELYSDFADYAEDNDKEIIVSYLGSFVDANGDYIPTESCSYGTITMRIKVGEGKEGLLLLTYDEEGNIEELEPYSVENGYAEFIIRQVEPFVLLADKEEVTPDEPEVTPDEPDVTPDEPIVTPDGPIVTPDDPAPAPKPGDSGDDPVSPTKTPTKTPTATVTPETSTTPAVTSTASSGSEGNTGTSSGKTSTSGAKTGDNSALTLWGILLIMACVVLGVTARRRRGNK